MLPTTILRIATTITSRDTRPTRISMLTVEAAANPPATTTINQCSVRVTTTAATRASKTMTILVMVAGITQIAITVKVHKRLTRATRTPNSEVGACQRTVTRVNITLELLQRDQKSLIVRASVNQRQARNQATLQPADMCRTLLTGVASTKAIDTTSVTLLM